MRIKRWSLALGLSVFLAGSVACQFNVSTANLSSLKLGKDKSVTPETSNFGTEDTIYAAAVVSNSPSKVKVKCQLAVEDVEGQKPGPIPGLETTLDLDGSGTATFNFSAPTAGWPKGKYKVDVVMLNEEGQQKDQKTASFTVS
jgi:type 1 fimbria pilin